MSPLDLPTVLTKKPLGLVFDIDGTLSPIAPTSEEARHYPGIVPLLERAREHAHVAIMTGRAIEDGAAIVKEKGAQRCAPFSLTIFNFISHQC